ncbi:hypothetical protein B0H16DRAFT_1776022 [Mycena metata]|uniref:Uncharacterized protein n=1 Tax=Mycena metata TaxID=1033252 RepID=A0AAD7HX61_9AGAR|nr:hypothetical protein B0H16DRAFT_1776022 [Mycena metata]
MPFPPPPPPLLLLPLPVPASPLEVPLLPGRAATPGRWRWSRFGVAGEGGGRTGGRRGAGGGGGCRGGAGRAGGGAGAGHGVVRLVSSLLVLCRRRFGLNTRTRTMRG